jgi:arabinogalactan endo-1,4-beta-galactosidase
MRSASLLIVLSCALAAPAAEPFHRTGPFLIGADVSWTQEDEASGSVYFDHGRQKELFQILKDHGFNAIRLRVFVNPGSPRGYAAKSREHFCDLAHTLVMAKRARNAGMALLIDLHYSDTWADPGKQFKPAAWEDMDVSGLCAAVHDHTRDVLTALKQQGTTPLMVQIGNESNAGILWPDGRTKDHFEQYAQMIKAGATAAREVDPAIKIVVHHGDGRKLQSIHWWLDGLLSNGVPFDVIGISCNDTGEPSVWKATFNDLAIHYPQFGLIAAEYSYHKRELNDAVYHAPDRRGMGTFIWEPTRHHEAIFDQDGRNAGAATQKRATTQPAAVSGPATGPAVGAGHRPRSGRFDANELMELYPRMAKDYSE